MKKKVEAKTGKATVMKELNKVQTETQEDVGEAALYDQPTCNVGVNAGITKNLGNYESLKVGVSLNMPCYPDEIEDVYSAAKKWVDDKMDSIVAQLG